MLISFLERGVGHNKFRCVIREIFFEKFWGASVNLVSKMRAHGCKKGQAFRANTLEADWDIINEIVLLLRKYKIDCPQWIKAHQDGKMPFKDLLLEAKMSCEASKLAEKAHSLYGPLLKPPRPPRSAPAATGTSGAQNLLFGCTHRNEEEVRTFAT